MDLTHTPERQELKEAVRRFCAERVDAARLATWEREPRGIDERTWNEVAALGWIGLGVPADAGGSGLGLVDVACVLEECARGLIPRPMVAAIRGAWVLGQLAPDAPELPRLVAGTQMAVLALDEEHAREPEHYGTRVERGERLRGGKWYVPGGLHADWFIVAARDGSDVGLFLTSGEHVRRQPLRSFDGDRQAVIELDGAPARRLTAAGRGHAALMRLQREQAALALAEMLGGMDATLEMTVKYVKEREQFGQKIAVFQAVQHQVADMGTAFTAARHLAWMAITRMAAGSERGGELERALAFTGQAFKRLTLTAHHLHGGAGFVVEHPLHYHSERAQALCIRYAPERVMLGAIATALLD
jgi:alkylation response protein AidB-like acyl-CoA dehydrogenase